MSKVKYCMECGEPHPPHAKFCGACRNPFDSSTVVAKANLTPAPARSQPVANTYKQPVTREEEEEDEDDTVEGEDITRVPEIRGLDVEIRDVKQSRGPTLGEIAATVQHPDDIKRPKEKKQSRKEFLAQWAKETGSIKQKGNR